MYKNTTSVVLFFAKKCVQMDQVVAIDASPSAVGKVRFFAGFSPDWLSYKPASPVIIGSRRKRILEFRTLHTRFPRISYFTHPILWIGIS
jgi:hypothetical protein